DFVPVDLKAHQFPARAAASLGDQGRAADEIFLFEVHEASQADLVGRVSLGLDHGLLARSVVDLDQQQARLDASDVEREHADGVYVELAPALHDRIPYSDGLLPWNPDLVAQVARVSGARNVDRDA